MSRRHKPTRKFLQTQQKLPLAKRFSRPPKISRNWIIFRRINEEMDVVGFESAHSSKQARLFYYRNYQRKFPGERRPDITAIEETAFHPCVRKNIPLGTFYRAIPKNS